MSVLSKSKIVFFGLFFELLQRSKQKITSAIIKMGSGINIFLKTID